jgi:hypothetical protein
MLSTRAPAANDVVGVAVGNEVSVVDIPVDVVVNSAAAVDVGVACGSREPKKSILCHARNNETFTQTDACQKGKEEKTETTDLQSFLS